MTQPHIRRATRHDLPLLDRALRALSQDLGDPHPASIDLLDQAGFGSTPAFYALIALENPDTICGAVVFSPVLSTSLAGTGLYVSDLWVAQHGRGGGLGRRLLAEAARYAEIHWAARFLKLAVYDGSPDARRFYDRLGFYARSGETTLFLDTGGLAALKGQI
jgi:ribosomal protein S18 acetylase RimI-like enzyme